MKSSKFDDVLVDNFSRLIHDRFILNLEQQFFFACGGEVDGGAPIPPSFRDRFKAYIDTNHPDIAKSLVLAENFKDYFKDNAFSDLLVFEDEIANLATLILIFLESPGSLVELGMFCTKQNLFKNLLIIAPQEEIESEDSFIYLGPLKNIKNKENNAVAIYPWPDPKTLKYNNEHLVDLIETIRIKLSHLPKTEKFLPTNSGHIALLIAEIVRICYPILISEIEISLYSIDLDISQGEVARHLYLLDKLGLIKPYFYSGYTYYYNTNKDINRVRFGKSNDGNSFDEKKIRMLLLQTYIQKEDGQSRKRRVAMTHINTILAGDQK